MSDCGERLLHVRGLVLDLGVGEAQRRDPRRGVGLVAEAVAGLLRGGAVVAPAIVSTTRPISGQ
jgi:hypothetical protein